MKIRINQSHTAAFVCIVFFALSWAGFLSEADGAIYSSAVAVLFPAMCPYLLLMLASVQDLPGLSKNFAYIGFMFVFLIMAVKQYFFYKHSHTHNIETPRDILTKFGLFPFAGVALAVYALLTSSLYDAFNIFPQFSSKPYLFVGIMMIVMIISAVMTISEISLSERTLKAFAVVCMLCIFQSLAAGILQIINGPAFLHSQTGFEANEGAFQIMEASALGFPRITSSYLSPNAFALSVAVLFMIIVGIASNSYKNKTFVIFYLVTGLFVGLITLSKAMIMFFILTSIVLLWKSSKTFFALVSMAALLFFTKVHIDWTLVNIAFRFQGGDLGIRSIAWDLLRKEFGVTEWIFGTGFSYWNSFFMAHIGKTLADPHSFVFSVPGMFGILGVIFYFALACIIIKQIFFGKGNKAVMAAMLFILVFIKDLASVPYVLSNSTVSYMIWICIMSMCMKHIKSKDINKNGTVIPATG